MTFLKESGGQLLLSLHVQPKASRSAIVGVHGESLKVAVQAPPVDGAANEALVEFLADFFGIPKRAVLLKSGASSRKKVFALEGLGLEEARRLLEEYL